MLFSMRASCALQVSFQRRPESLAYEAIQIGYSKLRSWWIAFSEGCAVPACAGM